MLERKPALCEICPGGCGIIAALQNGKLIKVEADKEVPYGNLCVTDINNRDPISGFPVFKALLCEIEKAQPG